MPKSTKNEKTGTDFIDQQRNIDNAINENQKNDSQQENDRNVNGKQEYKPDPSVKKTGRTKE